MRSLSRSKFNGESAISWRDWSPWPGSHVIIHRRLSGARSFQRADKRAIVWKAAIVMHNL